MVPLKACTLSVGGSGISTSMKQRVPRGGGLGGVEFVCTRHGHIHMICILKSQHARGSERVGTEIYFFLDNTSYVAQSPAMFNFIPTCS